MTSVSTPVDRIAGSRFAGRYRRLADVPDWPFAAGTLLALIALTEVVLRGAGTPQQTFIFALLLAVFSAVPLAFAQAHLVPSALAITAANLIALLATGQLAVIGGIAQVTVLYLLGARRSRRLVVLILLPFLVYTLTLGTEDRPAALALLAAAGIATTAGLVRSGRRETAERDAIERAIAETLQEHAARGERARIARELHDVVAHHISMIAVQAETARLTTPGMPAEGAKRLVAIGDTARAALTEMRRLLGVLREDAGTEPTRAPQPGLVQLNELIDAARESTGSCMRLIVRGRVVPLDPGIELTAFRIVQEALTNVRRHAPGAAVDVHLNYQEDHLRVRVRDNGPGPRGDGTGHGLLGMRERASMVGGELHAGPAPGSGFLVETRLPTA